jgi:multidrug resistance efflux pump
MTTIRPAIDPIAHRAAMDAIQAQRAAFQRYARALDAQRASLDDGAGDRALAAADAAVRGHDELAEGARRLGPLVERATRGGDTESSREVQRQMEELLTQARSAEAAIQNMASQLEAWRAEYGRQLAEAGLTPGGTPAAEARDAGLVGAATGDAGAARHPYTAAGAGSAAGGAGRVSLIDRRG